jgi:dTDP-4-dehydrorhamnose reductase
MIRIVITGGKGQLGLDCVEVLSPRFEVLSPGSKDLDIASRESVERLILNTRPQVILNCAAFTQVDACETKQDLAWRVNADGPRNLAAAAAKAGARLIHISTDYVFDGRKPVPEPYTEGDETNPLSFYGKTKLAAEAAVRDAIENHVILRTAWMYGIGGRNFLKTMLKLAIENPERELRVVNDQFGSPTWSYRLALQLEKLIESKARGTYHATSEGYCTWYELATGFLDWMGVSHNVLPCTTAEYPMAATRPSNSILENGRLKESGLNLMQAWESDLAEFVLKFRERLIAEASRER